MSTHLDRAAADRYFAKTMTPAELLAADDHLASCAACRARLEARLPPWMPTPQEHLTYEELLVELTAHEPHPHLASCPLCRADLEELDHAALPRATPAKPRSRIPWRFVLPVAAAAMGAFLYFRAYYDLPPALEIPAILESYRPRSGVLLGPVAEPRFDVREPVATYVSSVRPWFRWTPVEGAARYEVEIYNAAYELVARGDADLPEFQPAVNLPQGNSFAWRVIAIVGSRRVAAPVPPAPEARFLILDGASAEAWRRKEQRYAVDPARLALEAANLGLRQRALELAAQVPNSPVAIEIRKRLDW